MRQSMICVGAILFLLAASAGAMETVTFRFEGEVTDVSGQVAANNGVSVGDPITGTYTFNASLPADYPPPIQGWRDAVLGWTAAIAGNSVTTSGGLIWRDLEISPSIWVVQMTPPAGARYLGAMFSLSLTWDPRGVAIRGPQYTLPRAPGFRQPGRITFSFNTDGVRSTISGTLTSVSFAGVDADFPASQAVWRGKPAPAQVPGGSDYHRGGKLNASLWFDDGQKTATLGLTDRWSEASPPRLYCGSAGENGPMLWQAISSPSGAKKNWQINRADLLSSDGACSVAITTIASLRGAAEKRLLYVEYERDGMTHRGQLWPKALMADDIHVASAIASAGQVVEPAGEADGSRLVAQLRLNEQVRILNGIDYFIDSHPASAPLERAALHCAPAGVIGPKVAELRVDQNARWIRLPAGSLLPNTGAGSCGLEINTVASLVEAYLQGNLYFRIESVSGAVWRAQVPRS